MRPSEQIPSCFAIANPGTGRASLAGREPNPVLIAEHRSQEPLGITARVASVGTVPSQRPAEPSPSPGTRLPAAAPCPRARSCNYPAPRVMPAARSPRAGSKARCSALPAAPPPDCELCKAKFLLQCQLRAALPAPAAVHRC